jgi:hypothetical protein
MGERKGTGKNRKEQEEQSKETRKNKGSFFDKQKKNKAPERQMSCKGRQGNTKQDTAKQTILYKTKDQWQLNAQQSKAKHSNIKVNRNKATTSRAKQDQVKWSTTKPSKAKKRKDSTKQLNKEIFVKRSTNSDASNAKQGNTRSKKQQFETSK